MRDDDKLTQAYDDLVSHLYEAWDETLHSIADAMSDAKEKVSALGGYTQEEINKAASYVMRDIEHAAVSPVTQTRNDDDLSEWLKFDIALIENFALDAFMSLADKTRIQLAALELDAQQYHPYTAGDITGPGTLNCNACGKAIAFKSTSVIPKCPACGGDTFTRC
ncbi:MAG: zinc ribbon-containing protein [Methylomonas sp.]|nr:zinc ribbon-containing protein [Methylomonas sp.]PPD21314.1 MAG: hypothetical protein CTY23_05830 [Methylomonas sp.]PPD24387.1 MAG: hypothetical protein CTY22_11150 [Methylomonas sp.]PPD32975.1 MAG: hypothetical protein CTY21_11075 [Methylomonas sp.]PPD41692.1 MAG: hypothetical protein CTY17_03145 [Methylomonas sp.]